MKLGDILKISFAQLKSAKLFTATIVIILSLVIGISSTLFNIGKLVFISDLPYQDADKLKSLDLILTSGSGNSYGNALGFAELLAKEDLKYGEYAYVQKSSKKIRINDRASIHDVAYVSEKYFKFFGLDLAAGRPLSVDDFKFSGNPPILISEELAKLIDDVPSAVVGKLIEVDGTKKEIVGVVSSGYLSPYKISGDNIMIWIPTSDTNIDRNNFSVISNQIKIYLRAFGEKKPDEDQLKLLIDQNIKSFQPAHFSISPRLIDLREALLGSSYEAVKILLISVTTLLFFAFSVCVSMVAVRAYSRTRIIALHHVLGATKNDVQRIVISENTILIGFALAMGMVVAQYSIIFIKVFFADYFPRLPELSFNLPIVFFSLLVFMLSSVVLSFFSFYTTRSLSVISSLKGSGKGVVSGSIGNFKKAVFSFQVFVAALTLSLAFQNLWIGLDKLLVNNGVKNNDAIVLQVDLPNEYRSEGSKYQLADTFIDRFKKLGSVDKISVIDYPPFFNGAALAPISSAKGDFIGQMQVNGVSEEYFQMLGLKNIEGRYFSYLKDASLKEAVVSLSVAKIVKGNGSVLGEKIMYEDNMYTIVGVVSDVVNPILNIPGSENYIYVPFKAYDGVPTLNFLITESKNSKVEIGSISNVLYEINRELFANSFEAIYKTYGELLSVYKIRTILSVSLLVIILFMIFLGTRNVILNLVDLMKSVLNIHIAVGASQNNIKKLVISPYASSIKLSIGFGAISGFIANYYLTFSPEKSVLLSVSCSIASALLLMFIVGWLLSFTSKKYITY